MLDIHGCATKTDVHERGVVIICVQNCKPWYSCCGMEQICHIIPTKNLSHIVMVQSCMREMKPLWSDWSPEAIWSPTLKLTLKQWAWRLSIVKITYLTSWYKSLFCWDIKSYVQWLIWQDQPAIVNFQCRKQNAAKSQSVGPLYQVCRIPFPLFGWAIGSPLSLWTLYSRVVLRGFRDWLTGAVAIFAVKSHDSLWKRLLRGTSVERFDEYLEVFIMVAAVSLSCHRGHLICTQMEKVLRWRNNTRKPSLGHSNIDKACMVL